MSSESNDSFEVQTGNSVSSDENSILEQLKKSLKIAENEFLESEIADLKEFFTVDLVEHDPINEEQMDELNYDRFWVKVSLPVTFRRISKDGKETIKERKAEISFRIKLKNGKFVVKIERQGKQGEKECEKEKEEELSKECKVESNEYKMVKDEDNLKETEVDFIEESDEIPYEIEQVEIITIEDEEIEEERLILESIMKNLLEINDLALLNIIEEFYVQLESINYPHKEIICRDYYYPIFDCRHWGRPKSPPNNNSKSLGIPLSSFSLTNSSSLDLPGGTFTYRARALYDFQALMQGELSFQENEILIVLANLGNGWLTARRSSNTNDSNPNINSNSNNNNTDDNMTGLIPENYIERL